jgi:exopolysaccharide production protein ExoQ
MAFFSRIRVHPSQPGPLDAPLAAEALALATLVLSWTASLGAISIVLQLTVLVALIVIRPATLLQTLTRAWPLMAIPLLVCLSTIWSTAPGVSLRYGAQMLVTAVIGLALVAALPLRALVRAIFLSALMVCLICIVDGRQGPSITGPVLIGILGSKNLMAVLAQLLLASAVAVVVDRQQPTLVRLLGVVGVPVASFVLLKGESAGGLVTAALGLLLFVALRSFGALDLRWRTFAVVAAIAVLIPLAVGSSLLLDDAQHFSATVLHKDPGLTGRDYLWAHADKMIAERPWLGHGFRSAWLGGDADNIGLLRWAGVTDGKGFHFHDTYREWAVDFGLVGAALICGLLALAGARIVVRAVTAPSAPSAFLTAMFLIMAIRAKVENVFLPFAPATVLLFVLAFWGWLGSREVALAPPEPEPVRLTGRRSRPGPRFDPARAMAALAARRARARAE